MSTLKVNTIEDLSGNPNKGKIIQIVQSTKTDTASITGGTFSDVGLSAQITPSSASNKVLVMVQATISGSVGFDMKARLMRGSNPIHVGDTAGSRPRATVNITQTYHSTNYYNCDQAIINYLDTPGAGTHTYKIQFASYSTYVLYINRTGSDLNTAEYDGRTASSIILMEVSG